MFVSWCPAYFTHDVFKVHPCYSRCQNLTSFPGLIILHCAYIPYFLFIHSLIVGHVGCFQATQSHFNPTKYDFGMYSRVTHYDRSYGMYNSASDTASALKELMIHWTKEKKRSERNQHCLLIASCGPGTSQSLHKWSTTL